MRTKFLKTAACAVILAVILTSAIAGGMTLAAEGGEGLFAALAVLPERLELSTSGGEQLVLNTTKEVSARFFPSETTERELTWLVEKPELVKVTKALASADTYVIEGLMAGSTLLTATSSADSEVAANMAVTVIYADVARPDKGSGCNAAGFGALALGAVISFAARKK